MNKSSAANAQTTGASAWRTGRIAWLALASVGLVGACAKGDIVGGNTVQIKGAEATDGFLPQPELLAHNEGTLWDLTYIKPGIDMHAYNAVYIAPVTIVADPSSQLATVPEDQRNKLADTLYADVYDGVSKSCKVATAPGPGVVNFHIALSNATSSNGAVKTVATYVPYVNIAYKAGSLAFNNGVGYFAGTATAEAYATDGGTNDLLWQGVDKRGGNTPLLQNTTAPWLDVHHAFQAWSTQLVTKLEQNGICAAPSTTKS